MVPRKLSFIISPKPKPQVLKSMINLWTKFSEPSLHGNGETDIIKKTLHKFNNSLDHGNEVKVG